MVLPVLPMQLAEQYGNCSTHKTNEINRPDFKFQRNSDIYAYSSKIMHFGNQNMTSQVYRWLLQKSTYRESATQAGAPLGMHVACILPSYAACIWSYAGHQRRQ